MNLQSRTSVDFQGLDSSQCHRDINRVLYSLWSVHGFLKASIYLVCIGVVLIHFTRYLLQLLVAVHCRRSVYTGKCMHISAVFMDCFCACVCVSVCMLVCVFVIIYLGSNQVAFSIPSWPLLLCSGSVPFHITSICLGCVYVFLCCGKGGFVCMYVCVCLS